MTIWCLSFLREFSSWIHWCQWIRKHQSVIIELNCHHCWCLHFQREFIASNDDNLMFTFSKRIGFDHLFCRPSTCRTVASLACFSFHHQKLSFQQIIINKFQIRIIRNGHIIIKMVLWSQIVYRHIFILFWKDWKFSDISCLQNGFVPEKFAPGFRNSWCTITLAARLHLIWLGLNWWPNWPQYIPSSISNPIISSTIVCWTTAKWQPHFPCLYCFNPTQTSRRCWT